MLTWTTFCVKPKSLIERFLPQYKGYLKAMPDLLRVFFSSIKDQQDPAVTNQLDVSDDEINLPR